MMIQPRLLSLALLIALPALGSPLDAVSSGAAENLAKATQQLTALRNKIAAETLPKSRELNELELKLTSVKASFEDVDRVLASKQLTNTNLQTSVKQKTEENAYLASILDEFARGMETRLFSGEAPRYKPIIDEAKLVMTNTDMGVSDKFARQIAVVKASLTRLEDIIGGARFPGEAVDSKGVVQRGAFTMIGPAVLFAADYGDLAGVAVAQASSPKPIIRAIPSAEEIAEPHEKLMLWWDKLRGAGKAEAERPGITALVKEGNGWLPLDPTKGAALRDLIHKTNLIEMFVHGGIIMWPLLLASIAAFTVVLERLVFIVNESRKRSRRKFEEFFMQCERHDLDGAVAVSKTTKDFVVVALGYALEHRERSLTGALAYSSQSAMKKWNRGLVVMDTVITLAPMLGLLGTVTGMMGSFQAISGDSGGNPTAIMGGISEALIATAFGLVVALICLLPYNYLNGKIEAAQKELDTAAARLEILIVPPAAAFDPPAPPTAPSGKLRRLGTAPELAVEGTEATA